jgi:selenocysteine lyase/cysteine desulfurase
VRLSLGPFLTVDDVEHAAAGLVEIAESMKPARR